MTKTTNNHLRRAQLLAAAAKRAKARGDHEGAIRLLKLAIQQLDTDAGDLKTEAKPRA